MFILSQDATPDTAMGLGTFAMIVSGLVAGSIVWKMGAYLVAVARAPKAEGETAGEAAPKADDKSIVIGPIQLEKKMGGKSGTYQRRDDCPASGPVIS